MKLFFTKYKILILSIFGAVLAVTLAILIAFAVADSAKVVYQNDDYLSYLNGNSSLISTHTLSNEPQETTVPLVITSPSKQDVSVSESHFAITGTSDPGKPLAMNGTTVERTDTGAFSIDTQLTPGENVFVFEYDGQSIKYIIRYNFTVIKAYAPYEKQSYEAGSSFVAVALARVNSTSVTATFNGQTINLVQQPYDEGEEFTNFAGSFTLPGGNETDINLGGVKFTASCEGHTNSFTSPSIICLRDKSLDGTQVVEIIASQAETFNGDTADDWSRPTNSYLPQGTVDYKVGGIVYDANSGNSYYNLRCGKRVYINKKNSPDTERVTVSKIYQDTLPEYNTISLAENNRSDKHSTLTFNTDWRAPFAVEIGPQSYNNPSKQDYSIAGVTFSYIDIKFFYTQSIGGEFSFVNHPLFASSEILPSDNGCILRLHLNQVGAFYGWNAEYNSNGQLVFKFLNAPTVTRINSLKGIKIVIDAGHGGRDIGAPGINPNVYPEAERNLSLAYKLKSQLESYGATVVMTRTSNVEMSSDARCEFLRRESPDLCISIHHDSSTRASASGGSFFCFNAFSDKAVKYVYDRTFQRGFYTTMQKSWHYFYLARVTSCPVILTENGFISNQHDYAGIIDEGTNTLKAEAITLGVLDYFNSFYKTVANTDDNSYNNEIEDSPSIESGDNQTSGDNIAQDKDNTEIGGNVENDNNSDDNKTESGNDADSAGSTENDKKPENDNNDKPDGETNQEN